MISAQRGLKDEGIMVRLTKPGHWFGVARRTTGYKPTQGPARVSAAPEEPIKEIIEAASLYEYCTLAALLAMNINPVQRIYEVKGWQSCISRVGQSLRIEATISCAEGPDQR